MDIDLYLLNQTLSNDDLIFSLRFYTWEGDWISIGYHQKSIPTDWLSLSKKGVIKIIRRPSGGGAVLHSGGITYALTFTKPNYKNFSYELVNDWLINSFSKLNIILKNGEIKKSAIRENCFGSAYICDLVDNKGYKRIGSAQYSRKGSFLQHGEILINPPKELWIKVFKEKAPPSIETGFSQDQIIQQLTNSFVENYSNKSTKIINLNYEVLEKMMKQSKD